MFHYGLDTILWTDDFSKDDLTRIDEVKRMKFDLIDIFISNPNSFPKDEVKEKLKINKLDIAITSCLTEQTNILNPDINIRKAGIKYLKELIDLAEYLEAKLLSGMLYGALGVFAGRPRTKEEWEWSVGCLKETALYAREKGVDLAVEPVAGNYTNFLNNAEDTVNYCKEIGTGNIKVHLDTFHMIREESDFVDAVKTCGKEFLGYIHVCENNRDVVGSGLVPWRDFIIALKEIEYNGFLTFELFNPEFNYGVGVFRKFKYSGEETVLKGLKYLKKLEKELKNN